MHANILYILHSVELSGPANVTFPRAFFTGNIAGRIVDTGRIYPGSFCCLPRRDRVHNHVPRNIRTGF